MKTALVTGGSSGLGASFVDALVRRGYQVYATSRNVSKLQVKDGVIYLNLELNEPSLVKEWVKQFIDKHGAPDILINNAGFGAYFDLANFPEPEIQSQLAVMLESPIYMCRYFAPVMSDQTGSVIVNVASMAGQYPLPYMSVYNSAKAGLSNFSRSLMLEYRDLDLQVIDFRPGDFRTRFNEVLNQEAHQTGKLQRVWEQLDKHLQEAPDVSVAAKDLLRAMDRGKSGVYYSGDFFQAKLGPLFFKLVPDSLLRIFIQKYYKM